MNQPNAYSANFDTLGKPVEQTPPPWNAPDIMVVALAVLCIVAIVAGVFK